MPFLRFHCGLRRAVLAALPLVFSVITLLCETAPSAPQSTPLRTADTLHFSMGWFFRLGEYDRPGGGRE